jgi:hypothetical protein
MCAGLVLFIYICIVQFAVGDTIQLSRGMLGITLNGLTPPRFCTVPEAYIILFMVQHQEFHQYQQNGHLHLT